MQVKNNQIKNVSKDEFLLVTWDENYATAIPMIDKQHKELVKLTNQLYSACRAGNETAGTVFKDAMSRMVEYVRFHFSTELAFLEKIHYPGYNDHKAQHDMLIREILGAAQDFNEGKKFVPNNFVRTLKEWIFSHIAVYDKQYALYVMEQKKKGLLTDL